MQRKKGCRERKKDRRPDLHKTPVFRGASKMPAIMCVCVVGGRGWVDVVSESLVDTPLYSFT